MKSPIMDLETGRNRVGIVGLGNLGLAIASNLIQSGLEVIGYRRSSRSDFVALGGVMASSPASLASQCELIITCLPSVSALEEVVQGERGLLKAISPHSVLLEMSTLAIGSKVAVAERLAALEVETLDCPVSASVDMISQREGAIFASGLESTYRKVSYVLDAIIDGHFYVGEFGAGMTTKLCANLLVAVNNAAVAEAMCFARKAGVDLQRVVRLLANGGGGSRQFDSRAPKMAQEAYLPANGTVSAITDVVKLIKLVAQENGCATPLLSRSLGWYEQAIEDGRGDQDMASLYTVMLETMSHGGDSCY